MRYIFIFVFSQALGGCNSYCCCQLIGTHIRTTPQQCQDRGGFCEPGQNSNMQCGRGSGSTSIFPNQFEIVLRKASLTSVANNQRLKLEEDQSCYDLCLNDANSDMAALHCYYADIADSKHNNFPKDAIDRVLLGQNESFKKDLMSIAGVEEDLCGYVINHGKKSITALGKKCHFSTDVSSGVNVDLDGEVKADVKKENHGNAYLNIKGVTMRFSDEALERNLGGQLNAASLSKEILTLKSNSCLVIQL
ncbi:hypothetical protein K5B43_000582 [Vibrio parahaemolyticus]|nr:hypothetical protein [Vibrio parahaemolyticus]